MKKILYTISILFFGATGMFAQQQNMRATALIQSAVNDKESKDQGFAVFRTMESVRHGLLPGYKGVEVMVEQPVCAGQSGAIILKNPSGEAWKYRVIDKSGPLITEGQVGYQRHVTSLPTGSYLVQFYLDNGVSVMDEFQIKQGKGLQATASVQPGSTPTEFRFHADAPVAKEFSWDFGDGQTAYGDADVVHQFKAPGQYQVQLTANNFDCKATSTVTVTVQAPVAATPQE